MIDLLMLIGNMLRTARYVGLISETTDAVVFHRTEPFGARVQIRSHRGVCNVYESVPQQSQAAAAKARLRALHPAGKGNA